MKPKHFALGAFGVSWLLILLAWAFPQHAQVLALVAIPTVLVTLGLIVCSIPEESI